MGIPGLQVVIKDDSVAIALYAYELYFCTTIYHWLCNKKSKMNMGGMNLTSSSINFFPAGVISGTVVSIIIFSVMNVSLVQLLNFSPSPHLNDNNGTGPNDTLANEEQSNTACESKMIAASSNTWLQMYGILFKTILSTEIMFK